MLLNEIFNTENNVGWKSTAGKLEGIFYVDGEQYSIDIEEYTINLPSGEKSVVDVGFTKGNSGKLIALQKPARVLGSVLHGLKQKISELNPNIIMFGALDKNGEVQKRKEIYSRLASLASKTTKYTWTNKWYSFIGGEYTFISDFELSTDDEQVVQKLASYKT